MIIIKIRYSYKEFQNCPQATEVSHSREKSKLYQSLCCTSLFLICLLFCFVDSADRWFAICGVIACILWFIYLIVFYGRKTNKLIEEAIEIDIERQKSNAQRKMEHKKSVYVVGKDISAGKHIFIATNPLGGMVQIFSSKNSPLDKIYIKQKEQIKLKSGTTVKLSNCIIDSSAIIQNM